MSNEKSPSLWRKQPKQTAVLALLSAGLLVAGIQAAANNDSSETVEPETVEVFNSNVPEKAQKLGEFSVDAFDVKVICTGSTEGWGSNFYKVRVVNKDTQSLVTEGVSPDYALPWVDERSLPTC